MLIFSPLFCLPSFLNHFLGHTSHKTYSLSAFSLVTKSGGLEPHERLSETLNETLQSYSNVDRYRGIRITCWVQIQVKGNLPRHLDEKLLITHEYPNKKWLIGDQKMQLKLNPHFQKAKSRTWSQVYYTYLIITFADCFCKLPLLNVYLRTLPQRGIWDKCT